MQNSLLTDCNRVTVFLKDNNNAALDELMGRQASFVVTKKPFNHRYVGVSDVASYRAAYKC